MFSFQINSHEYRNSNKWRKSHTCVLWYSWVLDNIHYNRVVLSFLIIEYAILLNSSGMDSHMFIPQCSKLWQILSMYTTSIYPLFFYFVNYSILYKLELNLLSHKSCSVKNHVYAQTTCPKSVFQVWFQCLKRMKMFQ